ncbi:MAG: DUF1015 domain-containing protein [Alphaproteobacteria bacterium]|nr:DUF1015 domain-containing protein [Alphaproteobacteria bacterium]
MTDNTIYAPFEGIIPNSLFAELVAAPPYDVLSSSEAKKLACNNPYSFLHISKAEIDFEDNTSPYEDKVYEKAAENFRNLLTNSVLRTTQKPCFYVYQMVIGNHIQTGLAVSASVKAYLEGRIKRHELTRIVKEDDRVKQIKTVGAQTGPALLINKSIPSIKKLLKDITATAPLFSVEDNNKVTHNLWIIDKDEDIALIRDEFAKQNVAYIADGHHRSAAASRIAKETNTEDTARFLAVTFFEDEMKIMDYNRVVFDLNNHSKEEFLSLLQKDFALTKTDTKKPTQKGDFTMYLDKEWYKLTYIGTPLGTDPVSLLDVNILSQKVLDNILGIKDLRNSERIDFIGGIRGAEEIEKITDIHSGVGFMLYPTSVSELLAVADNNMLMPPKSTWFEPKLADGIISKATIETFEIKKSA